MNTAEQITDAALALFYRQGFHATGVDQLSDAASVTKRTLYRHFPSKDDLISAALSLRHQRFMQAMKACVEAQPAADRPAAYLHFLAHWGQEADFHGCAFINASAEFGNPQSQPHQQARQHKQNVLEYLEDVCTGANLPAAAPLARQLFLLGEGLIVTMQVMGHAQVDVDAALAAWQQLTCR